MRLKYNIVLQEVGDTTIGVAVGDDATAMHDYLSLNETGAFIVAMLKEEVTRDDILAALQEEYDTRDEVLGSCLDELLGYLQDKKVII